MDEQAMQTEQTGQPEGKKRKSYDLLIRWVALILVVTMVFGIISMSSMNFSLSTYQDTQRELAARYLISSIPYLQSSQLERIQSLLTGLDAYSMQLQAADMAISKSDYPRAASFLEKCILLSNQPQQKAELYNRLGCVYMLAESTQEAMEAFESSIALTPEEPVAYLLRGQLRFQAGDTAAAAQDAGRYVELGGTEGEMLLVAAALREYDGDLAGAVKAYDVAIANSTADDTKALALAERGRVNYLLENPQGAVADIGQARQLAEEVLTGVHYAILGMDAFDREDYVASQADFLKAARLSQESNAQYYEQAILCAYLLNDFDAIVSIAQEARGKGYLTATSLLMEGIVLFSQEKYEQAEQVLTQSLDTGTVAAGVYYYRGLVRLAMGTYDLAAQDFAQAIAREESVLECTFNRGICYYALAENEKARRDFQYVVDNSPDPSLAQSAQELIAAIEAEEAAAQQTQTTP